MISTKQTGNFKNTTKYLEKAGGASKEWSRLLNKYGEKGVAALKKATPTDTGLTANSWYYKIINVSDSRKKLVFCNSNKVRGVMIAIVIQYGHTLNNGCWLEGRDYINPAMKPIAEELEKQMWKEVVGK